MGEERLWCPPTVLEELNPRFCTLLGAEMLAQEFAVLAGNLSVPPGYRLPLSPGMSANPISYLECLIVSYTLLVPLFLAVLCKFPSCRDGNSCLSSSSSRGQHPWCVFLAG